MGEGCIWYVFFFIELSLKTANGNISRCTLVARSPKTSHRGVSLSSKVRPPSTKTVQHIPYQPPAWQWRWKQSPIPSAGLPQEANRVFVVVCDVIRALINSLVSVFSDSKNQCFFVFLWLSFSPVLTEKAEEEARKKLESSAVGKTWGEFVQNFQTQTPPPEDQRPEQQQGATGSPQNEAQSLMWQQLVKLALTGNSGQVEEKETSEAK